MRVMVTRGGCERVTPGPEGAPTLTFSADSLGVPGT